MVYNLKYLLNSFVKRNKQLEKCSVIEQKFICVTTDTPIMDFMLLWTSCIVESLKARGILYAHVQL